MMGLHRDGKIVGILEDIATGYDTLTTTRQELSELLMSKINEISDESLKSEILALCQMEKDSFSRSFGGRIQIEKLISELSSREFQVEEEEPKEALVLIGEDSKRIKIKNIGYEWTELVTGMELMKARTEGFEHGTVIKCRTEAKRLEPHRHVEREAVFLLSGRLVDHKTGREIGPFESMTFEPMQEHEIEYLTDSFAILLFSPKLAEIQ